MKINKFNENTKDEIIDSINNKEYVIEMYDKNRVQIYSGTHNMNISEAIEKYYELKNNQLKHGLRYIFLVEKELKVLTEEEIQMLKDVNKYNI